MEDKLIAAAVKGNVGEVRKILAENRDIIVNWKNEYGWTALHEACSYGHDKIVAMLLAHPDIDVKHKNDFMASPFTIACANGKTSCVQLLLRDDRVTTFNEFDRDDHTPLCYAAKYGYLEIIEWWIASGRDMDMRHPKRGDDVIRRANKIGNSKVVSLLERFRDHPEKTRNEIRKKVGWLEKKSEIFAMMIFLCDGLLTIKKKKKGKETRFFSITQRLPMELQMLLCHRVVGSAGENISVEQSELAFKNLARELLLLN
jgi:hypothetical protein